MKVRLPITITPKQVATFIDKYGDIMGLGLFFYLLKRMSPIGRQTILSTLADAMKNAKEESEGRVDQLPQKTYMGSATLSAQQKVSSRIDTELEDIREWQKIIPHPSIVIVLGKKGSGKSAVSYWLLELLRYVATPYVLGIPAQAQRKLPDWIKPADNFDDIPSDSVVLIDEAYLLYHSRESMGRKSKEISRIVNLSRQRNQTLIFVTQEARQIDINITSQADVIIFKEPGMLQMEFDRPQLALILKKAKQAFDNIIGDKKTWSFVYSQDADFKGLVQNRLPTFWSRRLSRAFANLESPSGKRLDKRIDKESEKAKAKELYPRLKSYRKVADIMNVTPGTIYNWVNNYPYRSAT